MVKSVTDSHSMNLIFLFYCENILNLQLAVSKKKVQYHTSTVSNISIKRFFLNEWIIVTQLTELKKRIQCKERHIVQLLLLLLTSFLFLFFFSQFFYFLENIQQRTMTKRRPLLILQSFKCKNMQDYLLKLGFISSFANV